jgi:hypothetical protein
MRLVITVGDVDLEFVEPNAEGAYPWLTEVGALLLYARAGHLKGTGVSEAPNVPVKLNNHEKQATRLLGYPLRAPAVIYGDDGEEFFSGSIATVTYGATLDLSIEA